MRKFAAGLLSLIIVTVGVVVFGSSSTPSCTPGFAPGDLSGLDVPAEPVPVTTQAPFTARVATWNTLFKNSTGRVVNGAETISQYADVIGLQEFNPASRRATVARAMAQRGWGMTDSNNSVQILYNASKYKLLAQDAVKVIDVVRIEGGTAGTSIGPKSLVWVQLQDRSTGGVFFVLNMHIVPDIDRKGHRRPHAPKRLAVRDKQRATALSVIAKLRKYGPVAWTEDSNVDLRNDQQQPGPQLRLRRDEEVRDDGELVRSRDPRLRHPVVRSADHRQGQPDHGKRPVHRPAATPPVRLRPSLGRGHDRPPRLRRCRRAGRHRPDRHAARDPHRAGVEAR